MVLKKVVVNRKPAPQPKSIEGVAKSLGVEYGDFEEAAEISQMFQATMKDRGGWEEMEPYKREALVLISHNIGRVLSGGDDSTLVWDEIAGYATRVRQILGAA